MTKQTTILIPILLLSFTLINIKSNAQFEVSAEIRPRLEVDNGAGMPLPDTTSIRYFASQRTRMTFDFQKSIFQLHLTAQDVRYWGSGDIYSKTGVFGSTSGLDFHEAWLNIKFAKTSSIKIGRQELAYDNQRLISKRNWNQYGLAYDAILVKHKQKSCNFDLALSYNTQTNSETRKPDFSDLFFANSNIIKTFNFLRINKSFGKHVNSSIYALATGYSSKNAPKTLYMTGTYGIFTKISFGSLEIPFDAYYQNGTAQSGKEVSAYAFGLNPSANLKSLKIGVGVDYLSGDDANSSDYLKKERTFNKFYGAGFGYHGRMNHYVYIKGSTDNGGLIDIHPSLKWKFLPKHHLDLEAHFFSLANSVMIDTTIINDKNLGTEIDTWYTFKMDKEFSLNIGFSYYLVTDTFKKVKGGMGANIKQPYWIWTMLTYSPGIYSNK